MPALPDADAPDPEPLDEEPLDEVWLAALGEAVEPPVLDVDAWLPVPPSTAPWASATRPAMARSSASLATETDASVDAVPSSACTHASRSHPAGWAPDGDADGDTKVDGDGDADAEADGVADADAVANTDGDAVAETEAEDANDADAVGDGGIVDVPQVVVAPASEAVKARQAASRADWASATSPLAWSSCSAEAPDASADAEPEGVDGADVTEGVADGVAPDEALVGVTAVAAVVAEELSEVSAFVSVTCAWATLSWASSTASSRLVASMLARIWPTDT